MSRVAADIPPVTPQHRGRFGDFDVLREADTWDDVTRRVVLARLDPDHPLAFFDRRRAATARALTDRLLAQDAEPRVPVVELIDARLARQQGDGWRHADMPEDWDGWRQSLDGLDDDSHRAHGRRFADLDDDAQRDLIDRARATDSWHDLPGDRVFDLWMRYAITAFYSHPWAWNEIGFGGPAYPRGYKALGLDHREPWERAEHDALDPVPFAQRVEAARVTHGVRARTRTTRGVQAGSGQHGARHEAPDGRAR
jgi:Gluconate 2-dehydrogenase subunit 3